MDGEPLPGLGISHWRGDAIVAWFDEYCNDHFQNGLNIQPAIIRCFPPSDTRSFMAIVNALPRMVEVVFALSEWAEIARKMEIEAGYEDEDES